MSCAGRIRHGQGWRKTGSLTMQCWFVTALLTILTDSKASHMTTTQSSNPETEAQKEDDERKRRRGKESRREASHDNTDSKHSDPTDRRRHRREWESQKTKRKKRDWKLKKRLKTSTNAASERASQEEEEVDDEEVQRRRSSPMLGRVLVSPNTRGIRILKDPRPSLPSRQKTPRDPPDWDTQTAQNFKRRTRELVCSGSSRSSSKQELLVRNIHTTKESSRGARGAAGSVY